MCMYVLVFVHMSAGTQRDQKKALSGLGLGLQEGCKLPKWVVETKLESSVRVAYTLTC